MKVYYFMVASVFLMVLFYIAGIELAASSWAFTKLGLTDLENFQSSTFILKLITIFGIGAVSGALVGFITGSNPIWAIKGAYIMSIFLTLIGDMISILTKLSGSGWVYWIAFAFIVPLVGGYAVSLIEFWEGRD